ncbi:MAG TPA: hypothetical protein VFC79_11485 [Tissierellaceae bacterium]|nr:hypothetical protein [Tissierellaceae bacterium]
MLNIDQQRVALGYALVFLKNEIESIEESIKKCKHQESRDLLIRRKEELELDLDELQPLGDRF